MGYQRGMDLLLDKMNDGDWAHLFPEGKVNMDQEWMRLKWGMGRLISECRVPPLVLPFWHEGLTDVLPHKLPYRLQTGQKVTVVFGDVIDTADMLEELRRDEMRRESGTLVTSPHLVGEEEGEEEEEEKKGLRKALTDHFQEELRLLREKTRRLHFGEEWNLKRSGDEATLRESNFNASSNAESDKDGATLRDSNFSASSNSESKDDGDL